MPNAWDTDGNPICPACGRAIGLRAGTDLARRPVHVDSDYLLHRRCWNPSAEAMLARELKRASGP